MKPNIKTLSCILGAVTALALCTSTAKAVISTTTQNSPLNFSATITTNTPEKVSGNSWHRGVKSAKIGNKQLLDLFAGWAGADRTVGPWKTAKLVVAWDWSNDVLVVDKTGTNVLFDATADRNATETHYFYVDFWDEYGVGDESGVDNKPGHYSVTDKGTAYFELYDDNYYLPYTDLWSDGGSKQVFNQTWDASHVYKNWKDTESATFPFNGDQSFLGTGSDVTTTATVSASGHGKGQNYIGWAD